MPWDSIDVWRDEDGPRFTDEDFNDHGRGRAPAAVREDVSLAATVETEGRDNGASARVRPAVPLSQVKGDDARNPASRQVRAPLSQSTHAGGES